MWKVREVAELGLERESLDTQALGLTAPRDLNVAIVWHLESKTKIHHKKHVHYISRSFT